MYIYIYIYNHVYNQVSHIIIPIYIVYYIIYMIMYTRTCIYSVCVCDDDPYVFPRWPQERSETSVLTSSAVFWRILDGKWLKMVDYLYIIHILSIIVYWDDG